MSSNATGRIVSAIAFALGLAAVAWVGAGFAGSSAIALAMTLAIGVAYLLGALEVRRLRAASASLATALAEVSAPPANLDEWLERVHPALRDAVRLRIEGARVALPGLTLTPYLVGLLVMLGMLGTFLGMVVTFKGAVFALEGSTDLLAIRSALAEPIKGLALAFGTSVAGVAASAMLGLMSAIGRRERLEVARQLDTQIAAVFRPFSLVHQRQETYKALQLQARALPGVAGQLGALMEQMERRNQQLDEQLLQRQEQFHREVSVAYTDLARSVQHSLGESLSASARVAGESLGPVVESAMTAIARESRVTHERVSAEVKAQLTALLDSVHAAVSKAHAEQALADQQKQAAWTQGLESMATALGEEWQRAGAGTLARQQAVCQALEDTAGAITERLGQQASRAQDDITRLLARSEELVGARVASEARWMQQQGERMEQLATLWRTGLAALRDAEAARGQAAVERLGELQAALAGHLATLGAALENPLNRLLQTASEVPQAAAAVIAELRGEMSHLTERDNLELRERAALMQNIGVLLQTVGEATGAQRAAIESLVRSAGAVLDQVGRQFSETLGAQTARAEHAAAQVAGSAIELASLGEAFQHGVQLFSATNEKLVDGLQRMEDAIGRSMARSDEQLAYYVAQAREVIDLSISAQQGIVEDLRRLHGTPAAEPA
jgi:hypothetical protein